jgi:hypothetical protein
MLEAGHVLHLPRLAADIPEDERRFLDARWLDARSKNISIEDDAARIRGMVGTEEEQEGLRKLVVRYRACACGLIARLFPAYVPALRAGRTSFRPARADGRVTSWRKDDTRLHVDAFPSRPDLGERILRVFANVNPAGEPCVWRIGEPFEQLAVRMLPRIRRPIPRKRSAAVNEANACDCAKEVPLKEPTDEEFDRAERWVHLLCQD